MDKQIENIMLLPDNYIRLKTGRIVRAENRVICLSDDLVYLELNRKQICIMNTKDYFRWSLWAHRLCMSHFDVNKGVVAYDNGYEHKSLPALFLNTAEGQKVGYRNSNHLDLRRDNLFIKGI